MTGGQGITMGVLVDPLPLAPNNKSLYWIVTVIKIQGGFLNPHPLKILKYKKVNLG